MVYPMWRRLFPALGVTVSSSIILQLTFDNDTIPTCCGIMGVVQSPAVPHSTDARALLLEGLTVLKNRGYDSAGIATVNSKKNSLSITKFASLGDKADGVELVKSGSSKSTGDRIGIAHTRWATHGGKTDENAHPHVGGSGDTKVTLVHNGTINNSNELKAMLLKENPSLVFEGGTDTEVVAKLIGEMWAKEPKLGLKEIVEKSLLLCDGSWGLCVLSPRNDNELVVACNGSPLVIGLGDDGQTFVASETSAFNRYTKKFIALKDGEIGTINASGIGGIGNLDLKTRVELAPDQQVLLSPAPHPHWTIKECLEQPEAIFRALAFGGRLSDGKVKLGGLDSNFEQLSRIKRLTLSACGTSLNAAKYAEKLMKSIGAVEEVKVTDAAEITQADFKTVKDNNKNGECGLLVVSQSGETKDVQRVVTASMGKGITTLSVVNAVGSLIARTTKLGVYLNAGRENAVASTKAFTTQVTVLGLVALWFRECRDRVEGSNGESSDVAALKDSLMRLPISFGMANNTREQCKKIAARLVGKEHCFVLGKGFGEPVAYEGALKIKEMCYLHAEGYSGGALKHGPFALIENESGKFGATPIILLIFDDEHKNSMRTCAEEVKARGAELIIITDDARLANGLVDDPIVIPNNGPMTALISVLPLQFIAYELALMNGVNPDTPRNLAKAVTVD